jgi:hypothetical protein
VDEVDKLRVLLPHWLEHNADHAGEFLGWAQKARELGYPHVAAHVETAAEKMRSAGEELRLAIALLGDSPEAESHDPAPHPHPHSH